MKTFSAVSFFLIFVAVFVMASKPSFSGSGERDSVILHLIGQAIQQYHYSPPAFDDGFSSKVMDEYISSLDFQKRFLLKSDIDELNKYRYLIDDHLRAVNLALPKLGTSLIQKRVRQAALYYREAIDGDFDFSIDEAIETEPDSLSFAASEADLKDWWRKYVKLSVLEILASKMSEQDQLQKEGKLDGIKTYGEMLQESVDNVRSNFDEWMKRLAAVKDDDYMSSFFNAILTTCDPHSEYYPPAEKESFDIAMSGKFEGIGATLQNRSGQTKVVDLIPGSASWRQGELEIGDVILMVAQGDDNPVDITGMMLDDAVKLIRGKKGSTVRLTVKKADNTTKVISIVRDVVIIEATYAKSSVLSMPDGQKVGYIYLPKFYADFQDRNGRFCSKDVKIEIEKLKESGVQGIVFDLRNNGGGSLSDAVDMTGLFIEKGPIVQVRSFDGKVQQLDDKDPSCQYDGPVVVLVNQYSASASEIMAAALQDYGRAIVMGSESSFGKGSVQTLINFDEYLRGNYSIKPLGSIKITIQKFYRINGGTTQLNGVSSDIVVPDSYTYMQTGEKDLHNAMPFDNIPRAKYEHAREPYSKRKIVSASRKRIEENPVFSKIDSNARRMKRRSQETLISLNLEKFRESVKKNKAESEEFKDLGKSRTGLSATFTNADRQRLQGDTTRQGDFSKWFQNLEKDAYLMEASNVLADMLIADGKKK